MAKVTKPYTFTVGASGAYRLQVGGTYWKILSATGLVKVDSATFSVDQATPGQGIPSTPFSELIFTDQSGASNTIRVLISGDSFVDGTLGNVTVTATVPVRSAAFSATAKTVTNASAQLVAANAARSYLAIQNNDAAGDIFIQFGAAAALTLFKIAAGTTYEMNAAQSTQEVRAIGSIGSNANIVVVEG